MYSDNVGGDELTVTLWDKDNLFKNGFLGMVKVSIGVLMDNQVRDLWYPLEKRSSKSRVRGNIRLWTQLTTAKDANIPFHPPFTTLDGASLIPYSREDSVSNTDTPTISLFKPPPVTTTPTLDESDFLHIEPETPTATTTTTMITTAMATTTTTTTTMTM